MPPISRTVRIGSAHGLHARPAKLFAQAAKDSGIPITIAKDCRRPGQRGEHPRRHRARHRAGRLRDPHRRRRRRRELRWTPLAELLTTDHDAE